MSSLWASNTSTRTYLLLEFLDGFSGSPQGELNFSIRERREDELSIAASKGSLEPSKDEDSAGPTPLCVAA